jgi:hypothetical protein
MTQQQPAPVLQQLAPVLYIPAVVRSCADVPGNNGPQWLVDFDVDFSQYPVKIYLEQADYPDPIQPGLYPRCVFQRDKVKKGKDPSIDYNWLWKLVSLDAEAPEDVWVGDPSTIDGSAPPAPTPTPAPAPAPQPSPAPVGEMTNRDDHPNKRASIEGQSADKIRADVLGIAAGLVAAQMSFTADVDGQDWHAVAGGWYESLMSIPSWSQDLHDGGSEE